MLHFVNPFPTLLDFQIFAPAILRIVVGIFFIVFGVSTLGRLKARKIELLSRVGLRSAAFFNNLDGTIEIIGGIMFIVGLFTQIVAIVFIILSILALSIKSKDTANVLWPRSTYLLLLVICLSLLLTGAGLPALDLPL